MVKMMSPRPIKLAYLFDFIMMFLGAGYCQPSVCLRLGFNTISPSGIGCVYFLSGNCLLMFPIQIKIPLLPPESLAEVPFSR
ncbi:hypothetical protein D3C87_1401250 [compost metagenome]